LRNLEEEEEEGEGGTCKKRWRREVVVWTWQHMLSLLSGGCTDLKL
jgi:hypothetical protein